MAICKGELPRARPCNWLAPGVAHVSHVVGSISMQKLGIPLYRPLELKLEERSLLEFPHAARSCRIRKFCGRRFQKGLWYRLEGTGGSWTKGPNARRFHFPRDG